MHRFASIVQFTKSIDKKKRRWEEEEQKSDGKRYIAKLRSKKLNVNLETVIRWAVGMFVCFFLLKGEKRANDHQHDHHPETERSGERE